LKDRRLVDGLSIEELERILLVKRREARLARVRQGKRSGRVVGRESLEPASSPPTQLAIPTNHYQCEGIDAEGNGQPIEVENGSPQSFGSRLAEWLSAPLRIDWRFVLNRIMLLIEVAAVAGLIVVAIGAWRNREKISQEAAAVVATPAPTTTPPVSVQPAAPWIDAVILPGGHTPPDARGFSQPEPIPEHLQARLAAITPQPVPTPGPEHAMRIVVPAIGVDHPVVEGDDWEALKLGVGHTPWSVNPGEAGNCILSAHNDIFGEIFRRLSEMELGDEIFVHTGAQIYRYVVKATRVIEPTQVEVMYPTRDPVLTLISSYPYLVDTKRVVVIAELES
jgi:sortase A